MPHAQNAERSAEAAQVRLVLDTNVVLSAVLWRGTPHRLLQAIRQGPHLQLVCSAALLEELAAVLARPSFSRQFVAIGKQPIDVLRDYLAVVQIVDTQPLAQPVCRDPDDDEVLSLALAAQADLIVSGDQDLRVLGTFEGIAIVDVAEALQRIEG